jgi:hypothetical protein
VVFNYFFVSLRRVVMGLFGLPDLPWFRLGICFVVFTNMLMGIMAIVFGEYRIGSIGPTLHAGVMSRRSQRVTVVDRKKHVCRTIDILQQCSRQVGAVTLVDFVHGGAL